MLHHKRQIGQQYIVLFVGLMSLLFCTTSLRAQMSFVNKLEGKAAVYEKKAVEIDEMLQKAAGIKDRYPDSAFQIFYSIYKISELMDFKDGMATALLWMGGIHLDNKGEPLRALAYFRKAYPYCRDAINVREQLLILWNNDMAAAFSVQGAYDSAMVYYYQALHMTLASKAPDKEKLVILYNNIGTAYYCLKQYDKAVPYLQKAQGIAIKEHLDRELTSTYLSFACIYIEKEQIDTALQYLKKIETLSAKLPVDKKEQREYLYGAIYIKQNQSEKAIPHFQEALALNCDNNVRNKVGNLCGLGAAYINTGQYAKAAYCLEESYTASVYYGIGGTNLINIYQNLAEVYDSLRDYKKAYRYKSLLASLQDSLNKMENARSLNKMETQYLGAQKDKQITAKQLQLLRAQEGLRKKNIWIGGIVAGALILLVLVIVLYQKQRLHLHKAKTVKQEQQVRQLKAVIEGEEKERSRIGRQLHDDIMVQLSIVKMSMEALPLQYPGIRQEESYSNIVQQLSYTAQKLRQTAHNLMPDTLLEDGLVPAIRYFCKNVAQMTAIRINFQHYGDIPRLPSDTETSIYRIVQELVQNVIKHAAAANTLVQLNYRKKILSITVEDDGRGMASGATVTTNKMGLKSVRNRLKALNGSIDIHQCTPHGTSVNIELSI